MPITISHHVDYDDVILWEIIDDYTMEDIRQCIQKTKVLIGNESNKFIFTIFDIKSRALPRGNVMSLFKSAYIGTYPNWGGGIFVGGTTFFKTIFNTAMKINPEMKRKYRQTDSMDKALEIIDEWRRTKVIDL